jgi:TonB family protein
VVPLFRLKFLAMITTLRGKKIRARGYRSPSRLRGWFLVGLGCFGLVFCPMANAAQDDANEVLDSPSPAVLVESATLPVLISEVPAVYPEDALASGQSAEVRLQIDVSILGEVVSVEVVGSTDEAFDRAAVLAARSFRFTPARNDQGQQVDARVEYVYRFKASKAAPVSVEGVVRESGVRTPIPGAQIRAVASDGAVRFGETDASGRFRLAGLPAGTWQLVAAVSGHVEEVVEVQVADENVAMTEFFLLRDEVRAGPRADEVLEITALAERTEISERTLSKEEIRYLPGTGGDVVRVIQNLPGVARAPLNTGQLRIRGTAPEDSLYFLDGARIPIVFHFSGLTTVVSSDLLEEVGYFPGSYSVRYGRALGGLVDLRTRNALPERSNGNLSVDLYQVALFAEQRIGKRSALTVAGRRSYADAILNPILNTGDTTVQAPRYYDFQTRWVRDGEDGSWTDVLFLLSDDRFRFLGQGEEEVVLAGFATTFQKVRIQHLRTMTDGWKFDWVGLAGPENQFFEYQGSSQAYEQQMQFSLRAEASRPLSDERDVGVRLGLEPMLSRQKFLYDIARPPEKSVGGSRFAPREKADAMVWMPSTYGEISGRLGPLTMTPGLRLDGYTAGSQAAMWAVDPRLTGRLSLGQTTSLKAGMGRHSQFPTLRQVLPESDGNPQLTPEQAIQSSVGVEQLVGQALSVDLTAFHHALKDLVVGREDRFRFYSGPPPAGPFDTGSYANEGTGRVIGLESIVRLDLQNTLAFVSFTLSRSERVNRPGEEASLFEYDQPLVINALATQKLPRRWRVGARVRYGSGNPYTPVTNRIYDLERREFVPVYGEPDSARLPPFFSLDIRVDKDFVFRKWTLTAYLDVQNATYAKNVEVQGYTYDYGEEDPVLSSPPLPVFGLRGEW